MTMRHTSYFGNPWLGMFIASNDTHTLIPIDSMKKLEDAVVEGLGTKIIKVSAGDSNLLGIYFAMNSRGIVLPNIMREPEVEKIREAGLEVLLSDEKNNAHGNNIAANDRGGIINPDVAPEQRKRMEDVLGIELVPMTIAGYFTLGSSCLVTNEGFLAHYKATDDEMDALKSVLKVPGSKGTVNTGTGFVAFGAVANSKGYVAGEATTAFEMGRIEEALGLIR
jgi:translation initiation factor 6